MPAGMLEITAASKTTSVITNIRTAVSMMCWLRTSGGGCGDDDGSGGDGDGGGNSCRAEAEAESADASEATVVSSGNGK